MRCPYRWRYACATRGVGAAANLGYDCTVSGAATLAHRFDACHSTGNIDAARGAWQQARTILDDPDYSDAELIRVKVANSTDHYEALFGPGL